MMNDSEFYRKLFLFDCMLLSCLASLTKWLSLFTNLVTVLIFLSLLSFKWCGQNEFVSQFTCLEPHLYVKIHAPRTHINTRK